MTASSRVRRDSLILFFKAEYVVKRVKTKFLQSGLWLVSCFLCLLLYVFTRYSDTHTCEHTHTHTHIHTHTWTVWEGRTLRHLV